MGGGGGGDGGKLVFQVLKRGKERGAGSARNCNQKEGGREKDELHERLIRIEYISNFTGGVSWSLGWNHLTMGKPIAEQVASHFILLKESRGERGGKKKE